MEIKLELPAPQHKKAADAFKKEFFNAGETVINGSALLDQMDYAAWLENTARNSRPDTVRKDWVVATTFFAVRHSDQRIIGMIDVRHSLDNAFLSCYGGHIGYAVRPSERRRGYATQMLQLALSYAKSLGLQSVMLGCYSENTASVKTIKKCGGVLTDTKRYTDGKPMEIYWISISPDTMCQFFFPAPR